MPAPALAPKPSWPKPRLVHQHADLFREPAYQDGQPYTNHDDEDDDDTQP